MTVDRQLLGRRARRRGGHPAVAAVAVVVAEVPARPDRHRAVAAAGHLRPAGAAGRGPLRRGDRRGAPRRPSPPSCPRCRPTAIVAEPSARDSMAAIGLAAAILELRDPDAVMGSFAADHVIADPAAFGAAVEAAAAAARDGWLVTIGIEPTFASSAFGYVHLGDDLDGHPGAHARAGVRGEALGRRGRGLPRHRALPLERRHVRGAAQRAARPAGRAGDPASPRPCARSPPSPGPLDEVWPTLPRIALDHAVAEPAAAAGRVVVVPASFGWDDIGDFDSLATLLEDATSADDDRARRPRARALVDATGLVVPAAGKTGRRHRARRRRGGRHSRRPAGDHPGARAGRQAGGRRRCKDDGRADLT